MVAGVPAAGAGDGAAVGRKQGSATPDATCTSNIGGGLVFGGRPNADGKISIGDQMLLAKRGSSYEREALYDYHNVSAPKCWPVADAPISQIVGPTQSEVVTLITCCGTFNSSTRQYDSRLVVRANRIFDTNPTPPALPPS
jgi:hypothetical protein